MGTVNYDLVVPDFFEGKLVMSDVVLTAASSQQVMNAKIDEELKQVLPAAPTATREFLPGDVIAAFAEVYDNAPKPVHVVDIRTTVLSETGQTLFATAEERSSDELQGKPGGYGHRALVPLKDISPGLYVLRVEARSRADQDRAVQQEVLFRVRPPS